MIAIGIGIGIGFDSGAGQPEPTAIPVNTSLPVVSGILTVGQTLSTTRGRWDQPYTSAAYRWLRDAVEIVGATAKTYVLVEDDETTDITSEVTVTNSFGTSDPAVSNPVGPIAAELELTGTPSATASVGQPYTFTPTRTGGHAVYVFSLTGTLPAGLSFNTSTGAITGTPTTEQTASGLNITVTDSDGLTASLGAFSITVSVLLQIVSRGGGVGTDSNMAFPDSAFNQLGLDGRFMIVEGGNMAVGGSVIEDFLEPTAWEAMEAKEFDWVVAGPTGANGGTNAGWVEYLTGLRDPATTRSGLRVSQKVFIPQQYTKQDMTNQDLIDDNNASSQAFALAEPDTYVYIPTGITASAVGTHMDSAQQLTFREALVDGMAPHFVDEEVFDLVATNLYGAGWTGSGGTLGAGCTGDMPTGMFLQRDSGAGSGEATTDGSGVTDIVLTGPGTFAFGGSVTEDIFENDIYDNAARLTHTLSAPTSIWFMPQDGGDNQVGLFEFASDPVLAAVANGEYIWRPALILQEANASEVEFVAYYVVSAAETVDIHFDSTVDFWKVLRTAAPLTPPNFLTAPAITVAVEDELIAWTPGTVEGNPTPSLSGEIFVDGVSQGASYTPDAGDVGLDAVIIETATNSEGTDTIASAAVEITAAGGGVGTPWDSSVTGGGLSFSGADYVATTTNDFGSYFPVSLSSIAQDTGKYYCEVDRTTGFYFIGVGDASTTGGAVGGVVWFGNNGTYDLGGGLQFGGPSGDDFGLNIDTDAMTISVRVIGGALFGPYSIAAIAGDIVVWAGNNFSTGSVVTIRSTPADWAGTPETGYDNLIPAP